MTDKWGWACHTAGIVNSFDVVNSVDPVRCSHRVHFVLQVH